MMRWLIAPALAAALAGGAQAQARERTDAEPLAPYKIILVGDSTMAPHSGWGGAFCAKHVKSSVACVNAGRGGRSTRSYRQEGSWDIALAEAKVPGYRATWVLIQFAHNDQSSRPERWTDETTEFPANLRRFVDEVKAAGATPVLVTPLTRREFRDGKLRNTLASWSDQVRGVAKAMDVPLVDLNALSARQAQEMGAETATKLAQEAPTPEELAAAKAGTTLPARPAPPAPPPIEGNGARGQVTRKFDYTHLGDIGAEVTARLVTQALAQAVPGLRSQLVR
ncbi:rhamnogalacturonan acetylesterase [Sphingopyxis sp. YF1]|jgi:lysophospholipase L1-like esterase|uniref:rhamnogalacturonan acetylesterase n=1 Tax=Sphingopyxis sp. YF1 TaxID=2482763 RepID=UPI001F624BD8|nr:rhamnogalacturonan acetylesterase [Sphingopyxis sp. YF1]UNU44734.1 rhamnogalacturonan acetylesterase [Sphingopyxis sp. YF1]